MNFTATSPTATEKLWTTTEMTNGLVTMMNSSIGDLNTTGNSTSPQGLKHGVVGVVFIVLVAVILMVSTVGGNLLVIIAYNKNRRLRSVNNLFLVSLACSDLVIGLVSMNLYPVMIIMGEWPLGEVACDIWLCIDYTLSMASVANLMLICLDRYFSVTRPFSYRSRRTRLKAKIAIILAWIFSFLLWSPAIMIWPRVNKRTVPDNDCYIQFFDNPVITSVTAILAFYLPVLIMIILYWRIFLETRRCRQYMEYLRSYKISHAGAKSPPVKRKVSGQNSAPPAATRVSEASPRRRVNSTPASSFRATSPVWRPDPLIENPHEPPCGKTIPYTRYSDCREEDLRRPASAMGATLYSPDAPQIRNNRQDKEETNQKLSHFQRFKRTIVGSIRSSLKSTSNDCNSNNEQKPDHNPERRDTTSSSCDQSNTSRRSSSGTSPHPASKNEKASLLVIESSNGISRNMQGKVDGPSTRGVVPVIVTSDGDGDNHPRRQARRTRSETDGSSSTASLAVPQSREPINRSESGTDNGANRIPSGDRKAARTLSAILLAFIVTWLPYNVCVFCSSFYRATHPAEADDIVPQAVWQAAYYLCYINSTMNPFCYAACNKTFRHTFIRLLTCTRRGAQPKRWRCWWRNRNRGNTRDRHTDTVTMHPSTSSSRSVPPSPVLKKRESSST